MRLFRLLAPAVKVAASRLRGEMMHHPFWFMQMGVRDAAADRAALLCCVCGDSGCSVSCGHAACSLLQIRLSLGSPPSWSCASAAHLRNNNSFHVGLVCVRRLPMTAPPVAVTCSLPTCLASAGFINPSLFHTDAAPANCSDFHMHIRLFFK